MKTASIAWAGLVFTIVSVGWAAAEDRPAAGGPEPINTVTVGSNRAILVNGKPFLPIMSWAQAPRRLPQLREIGFNTFCGTTGQDPLAAAQEAGGYAVVEFDPRHRADHPVLLAWIHRDEPDMPRRSEKAATPDAIEAETDATAKFQPKIAPADTAAVYAAIKAAGKQRPVMMTLTGHFTRGIRTHYSAEQQAALYPAYIRATDIVGFDIYPIYGHGRPGWLNRPADAVAELVRLSEGRPVYAWIETCKGSRWLSYEKQPDVLPVHTRYQVWGALIQGASGIGYFTHAWKPQFNDFAPTPAMQAELRRLNAQVTRLAPAILAEPSKAVTAMTISGGLPCHFRATSHDGAVYVFSQNRDLGPDAEKLKQFDPIHPRGGKATFTVQGLKAGTPIEVVDENRIIVAEDGRFSDDFAPLAEHVYRIPM